MRVTPARGVAGLLVAVLLALAAPAAAELLVDDWNADDAGIEPLELVPHRPIYAVLSYNEDQRDDALLAGEARADLEREEVVYQLSLKTLLVPDLFTERGDLWLGYTQKGWWQAFSAEESHPVRESQYEPELIYAYRPDASIFGIEPDLLTVRFNHLSDGRGRYRSRVLNRLGAGLLFDDGEQAFGYRAWYPVPGGGSIDADVIADYYGRAQFDWYRAFGPSTLHASVRNNLLLDDNRSSLVIDYRFPTRSPHLMGFIEFRHGYDDGLVDFDHASNRLSFGAMLARWR